MSASVRRLATSTLACASVIVLACSSGADDVLRSPTAERAQTVEQAANRGSFGVGVLTVELTDVTRGLAPNGDAPGAPERRMMADVWYPAAASDEAEQRDAALDASAAPYPLIVFAHGFTSFRRQSASYTQHLASHGYVVASIDFPGSHAGAPGGPRLRAVLDQPADISFVIDELLLRGGEPDHLLRGGVDGDRIGVSGHSLGGLTALLTAYGELRDERIDAIVPISAPACLAGAAAPDEASVPALVIGGANDLIVNRTSIRAGYEVSTEPKWFVELQGADHVRFADIDIPDTQVAAAASERLRAGNVVADALEIAGVTGANVGSCLERDEPPDVEALSADRQRELLRIFATPFFDTYLKDDERARALLETLPSLVPEARVDRAP